MYFHLGLFYVSLSLPLLPPLTGANVNTHTEETQETALTLACCGGFLDITQYLIEHGANIELGASTPLMEAAQEGHIDIVKYLIMKKADVHAVTSTADSPLTYAAANGHTTICDILISCGANVVRGERREGKEGGREGREGIFCVYFCVYICV